MAKQEACEFTLRDDISKLGLDYHLHTLHLGCADETMSVAAICERAGDCGLSSIGFADHLNVRESLAKHVEIRDELTAIQSNVEVFYGVEINLLSLEEGLAPFDRSLADEMAFEFVIGGPHGTYLNRYNLRELVDTQHRLLCEFASNPLMDVVVHPWWFPWGEFREKDFPWFDDLSVVPEEYHVEFARTAKQHDTAIEVNAAAIFLNPNLSDRFKEQYKDYIALLNDEGVMFSLCSDAHTLARVGTSLLVEDIVRVIGITEDRFWHPNLGKTYRRRHY